jgi:RNA polymerase sigma-70 factor, ECF subfamily
VDRVATSIETSDAELVSRAQAGCSAARATLIARYQNRVYNVCYRICRHEADALDLAQAALLKALTALPGFEARSNFFTWLYRIAVNLALSHRRAQARHPTASLDGAADAPRSPDPPADCDGPDARLEAGELRIRLEDALDRLDPEFRVAVVLKDVEDMDYAAIAAVLEVPVGTVKSRIHRGRMMLRAMLTGEET